MTIFKKSGIADQDMIYRFGWIEKISVNYHQPLNSIDINKKLKHGV
jgi:hypothetical protein